MLRIPDRTNEIVYVFEDNSELPFLIFAIRLPPFAIYYSPWSISTNLDIHGDFVIRSTS
jgi:hypothetical protein